MTVSLNFNTMKASPSLCLGRIGEHNATDLEITWTNSDERVASYRVAFQTGGKSILSDSFNSMPIEVALWQQLTLNPRLSIQIIAYDVNGDYIGKSDKFCGLYFAPSVNGINTDIDGEAQDIGAEVTRLEAEVADNTAARHTHSNKTVLDKFGETSGTPTYDGEPIGAGGNVDDVVNSYDVSLLDENKVAHIKTGEMYEIFDKTERGINYIKDTPLNIYNLWHDGVKLCYQGIEITCVIRGDSNTPYYMYFINGGMGDIPYLSRAELKADKSVGNTSLIRYFAEREYTAAKDNKLSGIAANAQVNVLEKVKDSNGNELTITNKAVTLPAIPAAQIQSDWEQSDNTAKDYIKNKPSIPAAQVQADWNESDNTKADYIKNKPTIPKAGTITSGSTGYATGGDVYTELQNIPSMPSGTNAGDILVWDGDEWVSKPKWQMIYQPCEWIRSSDICYFNTGYYPQANDVFTIDYQLDNWASSTQYPQFALFGAQNSGIGARPQVSVFGENDIIRFSCQAFYDTSLAFDTNRHTIVLDSKNGEFKYDGNTLVTFSDVLQTPDYEMRILASNQGGNSPNQNNCLQGFFYGLKVENGGTIIKNYIPVYNVYTGEVGIFDTANLVFISKSGSGTLTHGADVN